MGRRFFAFVLAVLLSFGCGWTEALASTDVRAVQAGPVEEYGNDRAAVRWDPSDPCAVEVEWKGRGDPDIRVMVAKRPDGPSYVYRIGADGPARVTFTQGSGTYSVSVLQHKEGNRFSMAYSRSFEVDAGDGTGPFEGSTAMVRYADGSDLAGKAAELCAGCGTDSERITAIYEYVGSYMKYDYEKAEAVSSGAWTGGCVPDPVDAFASGKGVCYDIAGLMAAMLRSQGVPCQLVYGYVDGIYHAWCAAMPDETGTAGRMPLTAGEWSLLDPTLRRGSERMSRAYLDEGLYQAEKVY